MNYDLNKYFINFSTPKITDSASRSMFEYFVSELLRKLEALGATWLRTAATPQFEASHSSIVVFLPGLYRFDNLWLQNKSLTVSKLCCCSFPQTNVVPFFSKLYNGWRTHAKLGQKRP